MCKKPLPCGSEHQPLAKALLANLLMLVQGEKGLETLIAIGKDMEILFRSPPRPFPDSLPGLTGIQRVENIVLAKSP
jgi:hypothetical protein